MTDLKELYQEVILDHSRSPRNFGRPERAERTAEGMNPVCGDEVNVHVHMDGDVVRDIGFTGAGCAISKASASVMTTMVKGRTVEEVDELFEKFHDMVTKGLPEEETEEMGRLAAFSGVCEFPARVKCASLAWHTMRAAIRKEEAEVEPVSTE